MIWGGHLYPGGLMHSAARETECPKAEGLLIVRMSSSEAVEAAGGGLVQLQFKNPSGSLSFLLETISQSHWQILQLVSGSPHGFLNLG